MTFAISASAVKAPWRDLIVTTYLISYDLNRPNGESAYPNLLNALRAAGATRILYSEWVLRSNTGDAKAMADAFLAHMDSNDGIFVTEVTTNTAWRTLQNEGTASPILHAVTRRAA